MCERVRISIGRQEISLRIASPHAAERMPRGAALRPEVADHTPQRGGAEAPSSGSGSGGSRAAAAAATAAAAAAAAGQKAQTLDIWLIFSISTHFR